MLICIYLYTQSIVDILLLINCIIVLKSWNVLVFEKAWLARCVRLRWRVFKRSIEVWYSFLCWSSNSEFAWFSRAQRRRLLRLQLLLYEIHLLFIYIWLCLRSWWIVIYCFILPLQQCFFHYSCLTVKWKLVMDANVCWNTLRHLVIVAINLKYLQRLSIRHSKIIIFAWLVVLILLGLILMSSLVHGICWLLLFKSEHYRFASLNWIITLVIK